MITVYFQNYMKHMNALLWWDCRNL